MIKHDLVLAGPKIDLSPPKGSFLDIVMLQAHVITASVWLVCAALVAIMAVRRLRRVPSALGLHALQVHRDTLLSVLWGAYLLSLSSGVYLLFKQAAYDPPLSGKDFDTLRGLPYGLPYFYALYAKIVLFLLMGLATLSLSMKAKRAAKASEDSGGPVDPTWESEDSLFLDDEVMPGGRDMSYVESSVRAGTSTVAASKTRGAEVASGGWVAVAVLAVGSLGIAVCVTLIKYFHELSKAAVLYYRIRNNV
jgi:hypothetical protein